MKVSLIISAVIHVLFVAAIIVPAYQGRSNGTGEIISVSLIGGGGSPAGGGPAAAPPPETVKAEKQPEEPKASTSKMAYKPAKQEKKPKSSTTKKPGASSKATGTKSGNGGSAGKTGGSGKGGSGTGSGSGIGPGSGISVDSQDFRFAYYLEVLRERIGYNWAPPPIFGTTSQVGATVYFKIARDGSISEAKIEKGSSHEIFDRSALRAVKLADPLPPLPAGFKGKSLGVHFEFQHTPGQETRG